MVEKGAIIRVDYEAFTDEGDLFDTTVKDVAKEHGDVHEHAVYAPLPVVVGAGRVIPGFDEALEAAEVGKEVELTIPPEKAYGERDPDKVETVSLRKFQGEEQHPHPGMRVNMGNRTGTIVAVTPGRVRIDYNPPYAGKTLRYKFTVKEVVEDPVEQVRALIAMDYGLGREEDFGIEREGDGIVNITLPDSCKYDQRWFVAKYRLVADLRTWTGVKTVRFIEEYTTQEEKAEEPAAAPEGETEVPAEETASEAAGTEPTQG